MRQKVRKTLNIFLTCFIDEITYCEQITDREALSALRGGLNMNTLFWRGVQNRNHITYDALVELMKSKIYNEELINHRNKNLYGAFPLRKIETRPCVSFGESATNPKQGISFSLR